MCNNADSLAFKLDLRVIKVHERNTQYAIVVDAMLANVKFKNSKKMEITGRRDREDRIHRSGRRWPPMDAGIFEGSRVHLR